MNRKTRIKGANCLACGQLIDAASSIFGDHVPRPGDITVCLFCGHIMAFTTYRKGLRLSELTSEQAHAVAGDSRVLAVQRARMALRKV